LKKSDYFNLFVSGMLFNGFIWNIAHNSVNYAFFDLFLSAILFLIFIRAVRKKPKELMLQNQVCYKLLPDTKTPFTITGIRSYTVEISGFVVENSKNIVFMCVWVSKSDVCKWKEKPKSSQSSSLN
jgi:hypothetical protein